ncbi:hypothetical protein QRD89_09470 [Halobacillus sp. ACCC02827]|uniref:hypothetical protein n=1 Tax=Halobacillus sp. ACCC02827 TaxID=3052090 RepID=UPI0025711081|nr:hypothetical protein [Halobacillus sp. ACCC02827]WJE17556.1 hypothetical protein QRD89_09470 [Halobacillus sp. ACCC02827]
MEKLMDKLICLYDDIDNDHADNEQLKLMDEMLRRIRELKQKNEKLQAQVDTYEDLIVRLIKDC